MVRRASDVMVSTLVHNAYPEDARESVFRFANHVLFERYLKMNSAIGEAPTLLEAHVYGGLLITWWCPALKIGEAIFNISVFIRYYPEI